MLLRSQFGIALTADSATRLLHEAASSGAASPGPAASVGPVKHSVGGAAQPDGQEHTSVQSQQQHAEEMQLQVAVSKSMEVDDHVEMPHGFSRERDLNREQRRVSQADNDDMYASGSQLHV